jgi:signal peptidase I
MIKRVVGLPGEKIAQTRDIVFINGRPLSESYLRARRDRGPGFSRRRIPENHFFVLGDNREFSCDSREIGAVAQSAIIGKVVLIYAPWRRVRIL